MTRREPSDTMALINRYIVVISLVLGIVLIFAISSQVNYQSLQKTIKEFLPNFKCLSVSGPAETDWTKMNVNILTAKQIVDYFYWTNSQSCKLAHDFGGRMMKDPSGFDGQKSICLDQLVRPQPGDCIVYSFGINNEWSFDDTMAKYGCEVFAFDPSMGQSDHNHSNKVHFYNLGLGGSDHTNDLGWKVQTLESVYKMLAPLHGKDKIIDYLKIDIESAEWEVLPQIIQSGMLKKVRQLGIEFHLQQLGDLDSYRRAVGVVKSLEDAGMVRFDSKYNPWWTGPIEALDNYKGTYGFEIAFYQVITYSSNVINSSVLVLNKAN